MEPIKLPIDIGMDIPQDIGSKNRKIRTFSKEDIPAIMYSVYEMIKIESEKPYVIDILDTLSEEEYIKWDLSFFGNVHPGVFADICVQSEKWNEVYGVEYIQPWGLPYRVFSNNDFINRNY